MGLKRGAPNLFYGALIYLNITKQKKDTEKHKDNIEKKLLGAPNFFCPDPQIP